MTAFHRGETNSRGPVGENTAGHAFFVARDPVAFAVAPDHETVKGVSVRGDMRTLHDNLLLCDQET
ncbi:hypothetical protein [Mesorhizobium sp. P5_C1]